MELQLQTKQKQILSPQLYQAMQVLTLNAAELHSYLMNAATENPLLEVTEPVLTGSLPEFSVHTDTPSGDSAPEADIPDDDASLGRYLSDQIAMLRQDPRTERDVRFLADNLDANGYLALRPEDCTQWAEARFARALSLLQSLEPAGVGARDVGECLTLQLQRSGETDPLLYTLAQQYLKRLAEGQLRHVAAELGVSVARVTEARDRIARLTPKPGNGFGQRGDTPYIVPDIEIERDPRTCSLQAAIAETYLPHARVSKPYAELLRSPELTQEERSYILDRLAAARQTLLCVEQRKHTLLACAQSAVRAQSAFLLGGGAMEPLAAADVAAELGVHCSTVYRTIRNKYVLFSGRVYPLSAFFARSAALPSAFAAVSVSKAQVVSRLNALIAAEDKQRPLSDQALAELLQREGFALSRRTVAKYRSEAMLPPASARKTRRP